jgi:hypothetical protein
MQSARRFGRGNQLASKVYRSLPGEEQVYALFCRLKSAAMQALKKGKGVEEVRQLLERITGMKNKVERAKYEGERTKEGERRGGQRRAVSTKGQKGLSYCTEALLWVDAGGRLKKKVLTASGLQPMTNAP